jgi:hypothetical protein
MNLVNDLKTFDDGLYKNLMFLKTYTVSTEDCTCVYVCVVGCILENVCKWLSVCLLVCVLYTTVDSLFDLQLC